MSTLAKTQKYRAVSAEEKYLEGRRVCDCHGAPMRWSADAGRVSGGAWRCAEKQREHDRRRYEANREKVLERRRTHYEANREGVLESVRRWAEANPEKVREYKRRWAEANPEADAMRSRQRRARKASALTIPFTPQQLTDRMSMWGFRCWVCGGPFEHVDHVKPLLRGGSDCLSNLRPARKSCNSSKGAKWPYEPAPPGRIIP